MDVAPRKTTVVSRGDLPALVAPLQNTAAE